MFYENIIVTTIHTISSCAGRFTGAALVLSLSHAMDPYRDENASLRAEVERLRTELAKRRVAHGRVALLLVVLDFGAAMVLRPWLNGASDSKFWVALALIAGIALAAVASAVGFRSKA